MKNDNIPFAIPGRDRLRREGCYYSSNLTAIASSLLNDPTLKIVAVVPHTNFSGFKTFYLSPENKAAELHRKFEKGLLTVNPAKLQETISELRNMPETESKPYICSKCGQPTREFLDIGGGLAVCRFCFEHFERDPRGLWREKRKEVQLSNKE